MFSIKLCKSLSLEAMRRWNSSVPVLKCLDYHTMGNNYELAAAKPANVSNSTGIVFLLGWMGCVDKTLVKYSSTYLNMGFTVIRFSPSFSAVFGLRAEDSLRKHARKMVDLMYQDGVEEKPVFVHAFSNGGSFVLRLLLDEFAAESADASKPKINVKGCILDSAPTPCTFVSAYRVIYSIFPRFPGWKVVVPIAASVFHPYIYLCYYYNRCVDWFTGRKDTEYWRLYAWSNLSKQLEFRYPQLCIYSKADNIVEPQYVEKFVEERAKRGVRVKVCVFQDSAHVGHFRKYPEQYESAVRDFVQESLK